MTDFDPHKNIIRANVFTDANNISEGEYSVLITQIIGYLNEDDYGLVRDAIDECLGDLDLPFEGVTEVTLIETGEMDPQPIWHKYYQIVGHVNMIVHQQSRPENTSNNNS